MLVAFGFLTRNGTLNPSVWDGYFRECHLVPGVATLTLQYKHVSGSIVESVLKKSAHKAVTVHKYATQAPDLRYTTEMVQVMNRLLDLAIAKNATWVQFLSDTCVPVTKCSQFTDYLAKQRKPKSFVEMPKSSQWMTIYAPHLSASAHIRGIQNLTEEYCFYRVSKKYRKNCATRCPTGINGAPDECLYPEYFARHHLPTMRRTLTYVSWDLAHRPNPEIEAGSPESFPVTAYERVRKKAIAQGCFFARKFHALRLRPHSRVPESSATTNLSKHSRGFSKGAKRDKTGERPAPPAR